MSDQTPGLFDQNNEVSGASQGAGAGNLPNAGLAATDSGEAKLPYLPNHTRAETTPQRRWAAILEQVALPQSFLFEARARVHHTSPRVPFRHLKTYWTTYGDADEEQLAWYYFWRSAFRQGEPLETSLSYLMLNIYEALHMVGFQTPDEAFTYLCRLHLSYREKHPALDQYLSEWLTDLVDYYPISDTLSARWSEERVSYMAGEELLHHWVERREQEELTSEIFKLLVTYRPEQNKFYRSIADPNALLEDFIRAIELTDAWYFAEFGESVYTVLQPTQSQRLTRITFARAVFEGPRYKYAVPGTVSYRRDGRLIDLMTQVVRYSENLSRTQAGYPALLPEVHLPDGLAQCLADYLHPAIQILKSREQAPSNRSKLPAQATSPTRTAGKVIIDPARLEILRSDSEAIRERLKKDMLDSELTTEAEYPSNQRAEKQPDPVPQRATGNSQMPLKGFLTSLPYLQLEFLMQVLLESSPQADLDAYALREGTMASVLLEDINERALDSFGDILLDLDNDPPRVNAAYQAELMGLLM